MIRNEKGQFIKGENIIDLTGKRFGRLTVIGIDSKKKGRRKYWICQCDCGTIKSIRSDTLKVVKSCGCLKREQDILNLKIKTNHGMTHHIAFTIWDAMMNRCYNPKNIGYKNYGGRGIGVCEDWKNVKIFCEWMDENGYDKTLSIERKGVNGNYCPENCYLIPKKEQCFNTRKTRYIEIDGERIPVAKTAREVGLEPDLVYERWKRGIREYDKLFFKGNLQTEYKG